MKKNIAVLTLTCTLIIGFSGCAGVSPTKPLTQDQKQIPNLHFGYQENSKVVEGALKLAERQTPRISSWDGIQVKNSCLNVGYYKACYEIDQQNNLVIKSDFEKDGSYLKVNRPDSDTITRIDSIQSLLKVSISKIDQQCFDYKNDLEKNSVEIENSALSTLLPKDIKDVLISENTTNFNISHCKDFNYLNDYKNKLNYQPFNYEGYSRNAFKVQGTKSIDWKNGSTKLSLRSVEYNFFKAGLVAENEDLLATVSSNTYVEITNKTDYMITLNGISTYYGEDISTNPYEIILAPHSVNRIGHQLKGDLYKSVRAGQDRLKIGIAAKYKINESKTLLKLEDRIIN